LPRDRDINRYENKGKICGHINPDIAEDIIPHLPNILKNAIVLDLFGMFWYFRVVFLVISIYAVHETT